MIVHDFVTTPVVVVGGGIAGLATALALDGCVVVANETIGHGSSRLAQGGVAAAMGADDSPGLHAADTLKVAADLALADIAAIVAGSAPGRIDWLAAIGVAFDRHPSGTPLLGREAGHSRNRVVHAGGDRTGAAIMQGLRAAVLERSDIRVLEPFEFIDLVTAGDRSAGVLLAGPNGRRLAVLAPNVVLATGGIGACFEHTTNPGTSTGAGIAAAARRGVMLADLEFVQFHPTALAIDADPLPLLTEALRGAGALLLDESGRRFMTSIHPDAELAPRDVVARSVHALRASGQQVFLDMAVVPELDERFPGACRIARAAGFEPHGQPLPVATAAHFHMGGLATDAHGACSMTGLWACGEVASTGLHGANRLASNSLLEGLVFGDRIARDISRAELKSPRGVLEVARRQDDLQIDVDDSSLRQLVGACLGPLRTGSAMCEAMGRLESWKPASHAEDDRIVVARQLLSAALERRESRGAHQRRDYPDAAGFASRSFRKPQPAAVERIELFRTRVA